MLDTDPFLMIPGPFESPHSQLSNDPDIIKNGSVYIKIRVPKKPILHLEINVFAVTHITILASNHMILGSETTILCQKPRFRGKHHEFRVKNHDFRGFDTKIVVFDTKIVVFAPK